MLYIQKNGPFGPPLLSKKIRVDQSINGAVDPVKNLQNPARRAVNMDSAWAAFRFSSYWQATTSLSLIGQLIYK